MLFRLFIFVCVLLLNGCAQPTLVAPPALSASDDVMTNGVKRKKLPNGVRFHPVSYADLPAWRKDDHKAAFATFLVSCKKIVASKVRLASLGEAPRPKFVSRACMHAQKFNRAPDRETARLFFETYFEPHKVIAPKRRKKKGLLTGYYEPVLMGSRVKTERFYVPVFRKPSDLVMFRSRTWQGKRIKGLTAGRKLANGNVEPYYTREQIDKGSLDGRNLEILYLEDEVDTFFLHIQGSGRIRFPDGSYTRIGFAARNGYPYSSIGRRMIAKGMIPKRGMSLKAIQDFIRADIHKRRHVLWYNKSFIFFRELNKSQGKDGPLGAMGVPLTPGRSLAVDTRYHDLGLPIYVVSPSMKHHEQKGFRRLMVAQDVGSAIKGAERGDIYWGSGKKAGHIAGNTGNAGQYFVLLPKK